MGKKYGYIRRSKDTSDAENQRFQIREFLGSEPDEWVEELVTGKSFQDDRALGSLIDKLKSGDELYIADVSRAGRTTLDVMESGARILKKKARLVFIDPYLELMDDIGSELRFFAMGLGARIQRDFISASTKRALARKKAEGMTLGRPKGSTSAQRKLDPYLADIKGMLKNKVSKAALARIYKVSRNTLDSYILYRNIKIENS